MHLVVVREVGKKFHCMMGGEQKVTHNPLVSAKGDGTLYIAFNRLEDIKEIHQRIAECGNPDLSTRNFIPPGFYERYMALSKRCKQVRLDDRDIKTQIRFGENDVEVLNKTRGAEEPYRNVDLTEFMDGEELPAFDHSKKWAVRPDRPPRRKIIYDRVVDPLAIPRNAKHALSRENSTDATKKHRRRGHEADINDQNDQEMTTTENLPSSRQESL